MIRTLALVTTLVLGACQSAQTPTHAHGVEPIPLDQALASEVEIVGPSGATVRVNSQELATMQRVSVNADFHGEKHIFEGVPLTELLARVGAPTGERLRGKELTHVVIVRSRDGYQVTLSLAETDPTVSPRKVILADRSDGAVISGEDGPFRLVVEGDLKPARSARMVAAIEVRKVE